MTINYIGAFLLIVIGLAIILLKKNLIKIVIGMGILDSGINLLLITAPIFSDNSTYFVDPIPQALTLTSIVIGACVTALALSIVIKIKKHYNSIESDDIRRIRGWVQSLLIIFQ